MNIRDYKNIYMIGIGGISMSGIAEILVNWGFKVSGSDMSENAMTEKLRSNGINVNIGQVKENITKDIDLVVYTAAIKSDNPELVEARNLEIETVERGKFLGEITKLFKDVIGVAGTHGKTTTSSFFASRNSAPSRGVDSYFPKFCSISLGSTRAGIPVISDTYRACCRPFSVKPISVAPQILFSTFHTVCPCLAK